MADPTIIADVTVGINWEQYKHIYGTIAAVLTTGSFIPQVVHTVRTRDTQAISLTMYLLFTAGVGGWLFYGLLLASWPMVISNIICFSLALIVLTMKIKLG